MCNKTKNFCFSIYRIHNMQIAYLVIAYSVVYGICVLFEVVAFVFRKALGLQLLGDKDGNILDYLRLHFCHVVHIIRADEIFKRLGE